MRRNVIGEENELIVGPTESGRTVEQSTGGGGACPDPFNISDKIYRVSRRKVKREEDQV